MESPTKKFYLLLDNTNLMELGPGDFFGERALLNKDPRAANVVAKGKVECLVLDRQTFNKVEFY